MHLPNLLGGTLVKTLTRLTLLSAVTAILGAPALCVPPLSPSGAQVSGQSAAVASRTGSKVPQDQAQAALDFQNSKRQDVGVPPLQWSADLAAAAQRWADHLAADEHCNLVHTVNDPYGENLFGGSGAPYTALSASLAWYSEIAKYHYGVLNGTNWAPTGHYTQMVWRNTTQVGMGQATCSGGQIVIVAEYTPPGNYLGQKPY
jgi:pathogenesis-related protein 1